MNTRECARVIVLSPSNRIVLVRYERDLPIDPQRSVTAEYWVPPGGGKQPDETFEQAAARELEEETGIELDSIGPCIGVRACTFSHQGTLRCQYEKYFVAWAPEKWPLRNRTSEPILDIRWWSLPEIRSSTTEFFPADLAELVELLVAGTVPNVPLSLQ